MTGRQPNEQAPDWARLYGLAAPQAGYFTREQARTAGYSPPLLEYNIRVGRVERVARAIFRMIHFPPSEHEDLVPVWLWSKSLGVFSHETALMLYELSDALPAKKHLTVPFAWQSRRLRVPVGVVLHYRDVPGDERMWRGPVPITTPLQTIVDCATASVAPTIISQAIDQGMRRGFFTSAQKRKALSTARLRTCRK